MPESDPAQVSIGIDCMNWPNAVLTEAFGQPALYLFGDP